MARYRVFYRWKSAFTGVTKTSSIIIDAKNKTEARRRAATYGKVSKVSKAQ